MIETIEGSHDCTTIDPFDEKPIMGKHQAPEPDRSDDRCNIVPPIIVGLIHKANENARLPSPSAP